MKTLFLILFFAAGSITVSAQAGKATKEQTIEYILNVLQDYTSNFSHEDGGYGTYKYENINFDDNILTIKVIMAYVSFDITHHITCIVNLKEIEKISILASSKMHFLNFHSVNAKKLIKKTSISYKGGTAEQNEEEQSSEILLPSPNNQKLVDAFNHLRKLCGAPEPITF